MHMAVKQMVYELLTRAHMWQLQDLLEDHPRRRTNICCNSNACAVLCRYDMVQGCLGGSEKMVARNNAHRVPASQAAAQPLKLLQHSPDTCW